MAMVTLSLGKLLFIILVTKSLIFAEALKCYQCGQYNDGVGSITPCLNYTEKTAPLYLKDCKSSDAYCILNSADVVKYDEKVDEVKIKTADISNKFKFFETYKPSNVEKKPFRITPPREGATQPDESNNTDEDVPENNGTEYIDASRKAAQRSSTTTKMLSVFRQMEEDVRHNRTDNSGLKPLKSFTPPPDGGRRFLDRNSRSGSEYTDSECDDESEEEDESDADEQNQRPMDEALQQAQAAARAKQLRAKFEKWEQQEIKREQDRLYDGEDQSQIDTRCIRAKFESLRNAPSSPSREKIQVNRFV